VTPWSLASSHELAAHESAGVNASTKSDVIANDEKAGADQVRLHGGRGFIVALLSAW
jgi:hypothetical protein